MVTKKSELSKDDLMKSFRALPEDATVEDFIEQLASAIGLPRTTSNAIEPAVSHDAPDRMKKQRLLGSLEKLPDTATVDDFAYRLYVILKIERGLAAGRAGAKLTQEEARERLKRWLQ
jgi:hypothetical protein